RFNFLNGLDCPDWLLAEIAEISKMTTIKYKLLCGVVLNRLSTATLNEIDTSKYVNESLDGDSIARIMTATSYIIENATLSITPTSDLIRELEQLGMTSEHSRILGKSIEYSPNLQSTLLRGITKAPAIVQVNSKGDTVMLQDDREESYRVKVSATQLESLKR
ncbi:hypothetical protein PRIPAC_86479, partial [Pristionchus pacificus]